jgi:hypothetical protein
VAFVALVCTAAAFAGTPKASANCGSDCYGTTRWYPATSNSGAIAFLDTSRLSISNACTQMAVSTFWEGTDNSGPIYWIENGIHVGVHNNGTCGNGVQFYWADNRPGLGYNEHYPGGAVGFGVNYSFKIVFDGGTTWEVDRNGTNIGFSNSNPCCSTAIAAGVESHQDTVTVNGEASGLQKQIGTSWSYHWVGATVFNPQGYFTMTGNPQDDELYAH